MRKWKRRALDAEARLRIATYHFDVVWTHSDGSVSRQDDMAVVNGTLDVWMQDAEANPADIVQARVFVRKVVDGVLVSHAPLPDNA